MIFGTQSSSRIKQIPVRMLKVKKKADEKKEKIDGKKQRKKETNKLKKEREGERKKERKKESKKEARNVKKEREKGKSVLLSDTYQIFKFIIDKNSLHIQSH